MIDLLHMQDRIDRFFGDSESRMDELARRSAHKASLSDEQVLAIRARYSDRHTTGETLDDIGKACGADKQMVGRIGRGDSYRWVR